MNKGNKPLVSVIVPIYNVELYIEDCLNSIIHQTYSNLEIILVDDGSPDNCGAICDQYAKKDHRIRVIHQSNMGLSGARNAGMELSTGEYITFVDSDDFIAPEMIESMLKAAVDNQIDIVLCGTVMCDQTGAHLSEMVAKKTEIHREELLTHLFLNEYYPVSACFKLYAKKVLSDIRFPIHKYHEDMFVAHEILYRAKSIMILDKALYWYRQVDGSITHQTFSAKHLDAIEAYTNQVQFIAEKCPKLIGEAKAALAYTSCKCAERMFLANYYNKEFERQIVLAVRANLSSLIGAKRYSVFTRIFALCYSVSPKIVRWLYKYIRK